NNIGDPQKALVPDPGAYGGVGSGITGDWRPGLAVCECLLHCDVERTFPLTAELALGLTPGPSLLRGLGRPVADLTLQPLQLFRTKAVRLAACLVPEQHVPAEQLVRLARRSVQAHRTAASLEALGAAQYRAGDFAGAARTLQEAIKLHGKGGTS